MGILGSIPDPCWTQAILKRREQQLAGAMFPETGASLLYMSSAVVSGHVVICMEYVPGGSLQSVLGQFGVLGSATVRRLAGPALGVGR